MTIYSSKKILALLLAILIVSVSSNISAQKTSKAISSKTGWKLNYTQPNAFKGLPKNTPGMPPVGMAYVNGGTITVDNNIESVSSRAQSGRKRLSVNPFFMDKHEVSIAAWREYVNWLKIVYGNLAPEKVEKAMPNEKSFFEDNTFNDPFLRNYFTHPAFSQYPVVGVSWEQAIAYCQWRTDRVNELSLIQAGIIEAPDFKAIENAKTLKELEDSLVFSTGKFLENGNYLKSKKKRANNFLGVTKNMMVPDFRLPTEEEWEYAAYAINPEMPESKSKAYPWQPGNYHLLTPAQQNQLYANYKKGSGYLLQGENSSRTAAGIMPVNAYHANDLGLYNLSGNINEWVADKYIEKVNQNQIDSTDFLDVFLPGYNENSRIYKGGSWKDNIYWINPSARRYLHQKQSAGDIGFRCVMSVTEFYATQKK